MSNELKMIVTVHSRQDIFEAFLRWGKDAKKNPSWAKKCPPLGSLARARADTAALLMYLAQDAGSTPASRSSADFILDLAECCKKARRHRFTRHALGNDRRRRRN